MRTGAGEVIAGEEDDGKYAYHAVAIS